VAPAPYDTMYLDVVNPTPARAETRHREAELHPWLAAQLSREEVFSDADLRSMQAAYYGLVTEVDAQVGRVIDLLRSQGTYDRTLIVLTSDHGEQLGDHHLLGKLGYFESTYRVPLIIRDPAPDAERARGTRVRDCFTEHVDVMPTLLHWMGMPVPSQCQGMSLLPMLHGQPPRRWRTEAHFEYDFRDVLDRVMERSLGLELHECSLVVLRGHRYKYVHFSALPPLLFDLEHDPDELHNRANDPAMMPVLIECMSKLLSWRMQHEEETLACMSVSELGTVEAEVCARV
jgi:arylsulfatase A-like enzyme